MDKHNWLYKIASGSPQLTKEEAKQNALKALKENDKEAITHIEWLTGNLEDPECKNHMDGTFEAMNEFGLDDAVKIFKSQLRPQLFDFFVYDLAHYGHEIPGVKSNYDGRPVLRERND